MNERFYNAMDDLERLRYVFEGLFDAKRNLRESILEAGTDEVLTKERFRKAMEFIRLESSLDTIRSCIDRMELHLDLARDRHRSATAKLSRLAKVRRGDYKYIKWRSAGSEDVCRFFVTALNTDLEAEETTDGILDDIVDLGEEAMDHVVKAGKAYDMGMALASELEGIYDE